MKKIAITTGDWDGIGLEVTMKALHSIGPQKSALFFVFRGPHTHKKLFSLLNGKFKIFTVSNLEDALDLSNSFSDSKMLIEIVQESSPARWVEEAAQACVDHYFDSLVTAPLSKQEIHRAKMRDIGHTDILKRVSKSSQAFMCFIGNKFNVILTTGHLPSSQVESKLSSSTLKSAINLGLSYRKYLKPAQARKPLGVLGLNPHAGDQGIIGSFEKHRLNPILRDFKLGSEIVGPLVPDVAFFPNNWGKYSFYLAQYHDQGLIPFKMIHGFDSGVHLTLGLPIKRSSVDHGTAKDLFGKNKANPKSMIEAIRWGIKLANSK